MSDPTHDHWFTDADQLGQHRAPGLGDRSGPQFDQAKRAVAAFGNRTGASPYWERLNRYAIAKDLEAGLDTPNTFDQGNTWLCGIATFMRVWASDNPRGYVQGL